MKTNGAQGTALYDAIVARAGRIAVQAGRKALIILSDGYDTTSSASLAAAIETAQRADALVYSIRFLDRDIFTFEVPESQRRLAGAPRRPKGLGAHRPGNRWRLFRPVRRGDTRKNLRAHRRPTAKPIQSGLYARSAAVRVSESSSVRKTKRTHRPGSRRLLLDAMTAAESSRSRLILGMRGSLCDGLGHRARRTSSPSPLTKPTPITFRLPPHLPVVRRQ